MNRPRYKWLRGVLAFHVLAGHADFNKQEAKAFT